MVPATVLASGEGMPSLVRDIGICIVLAGLLAIVFVRVRIPEIAAFLLAGVVVGPVGAEMVTDPANIETISELGSDPVVVPDRSRDRCPQINGQWPDSGDIRFASVPLVCGVRCGGHQAAGGLGIGGALLSDGYAPLYIGFVAAASSTLLVVKLFQETFQLDTEVGRIALGLLIFQDIWAIGVIAVQPNFAAPAAGPILLSFLGIVLLAMIGVFIARFIIPIGFKWVAKKPEVVFAASISWCFLIVLLGVNLDVLTSWFFMFDLHMSVGAEMGALIAGATIANLPYSTEIISKVSVVKDFFITLFFVGLGMSIPMPDGADVLLLAGLFVVIALLARYVVFFPLLYAAGLDRRNAMVTSVSLAQISEFSLVIGFIGVQLGQISADLNSAIIFRIRHYRLADPVIFPAGRCHS